MFILALFTLASRWKNDSKYLSTDEWIAKMWYIHTMEYYSAIKSNDVLIHPTTWMNLKNMLSERKQTKGHYII